MMLSLIIVSGVMSELSLRTLTVKRRLPARAQVGRSHLVEIEVYNNKGRVPSYAIEVEDLRAGQPADKRCFFLKISPRSTQIAAYRRTPQRRGLERHTGFRIATRFPFGLFEKSREVTSPDELVIYPAVDPVRLPQRGHGDTSGDAGPLGQGAGEEIFALRPMRDGVASGTTTCVGQRGKRRTTAKPWYARPFAAVKRYPKSVSRSGRRS